jgi:hypothetical protein
VNILTLLQILEGVLKLLPIGVDVAAKIKALISSDPSIQEELDMILDDTVETDTETIDLIEQWKNANEPSN